MTDLTVTDVTVRFDKRGFIDTVHVGFHESGGMVFFEYQGDGRVQYDGHVHSIDRDKAKMALENCPVIEEVNMTWTGTTNANKED